MSSNNTNTNDEPREQSFWNRTLIGIPFWILMLLLLALVLMHLFKNGAWGGETRNVAFVDRGMVEGTDVTPVRVRGMMY